MNLSQVRAIDLLAGSIADSCSNIADDCADYQYPSGDNARERREAAEESADLIEQAARELLADADRLRELLGGG